MRNHTIADWAALLALGISLVFISREAAAATAAEPEAESIRVPFSDPSRPGLLKIDLTFGSIIVRTHSEQDVLFEISTPTSDAPDRHERLRPVDRVGRGNQEPKPRPSRRARERRSSPSAEGMFVIQNDAFSFEVTEKDNVMRFDTESWTWNGQRSISVMVPVNTSLKLDTVNGGRIVVEGVSGDLELSNVNGRIEATNVSGTVVAETVNGGVKIVFNEVPKDRFMAFSSHNGSIDVTFPPDVKADLHLDSGRGSIYSDFEIELERSPVIVREESGGRGTRIKVERKVRGTLNGGGPEMRFKTYNGSIYLRSSASR